MSLAAVCFWQRIVSPHMAGLASWMAALGYSVTYVSEEIMSAERAALGWTAPAMPQVTQYSVSSVAGVHAVLESMPSDVVHICSGVRANGLIGHAQRMLASGGLQQWVVMETVEDSGLRGWLKRLEYRRAFARLLPSLEGVLAIGHSTGEWLVSLGVPAARVYPFAYFLSPGEPDADERIGADAPFRFIYVGQLIRLKRVDLLLSALNRASNFDFELLVVGAGPEEVSLRELAQGLPGLAGRIQWLGTLPMKDARRMMANADCLVLPSRYDGWGAVVSEALIAGTPAICSDACGSAGVVGASGVGHVFRSGSVEDLARCLELALDDGRPSASAREATRHWAWSLTAEAGARYLIEILESAATGASAPTPPWGMASLDMGESGSARL